jgi:hypothetical protein
MNKLHDVCKRRDIDIVLALEVTHEGFGAVAGNNAYINIGTESRGTAIVTKENTPMNNIEKLPSGRVITGCFKHIYTHTKHIRAFGEK